MIFYHTHEFADSCGVGTLKKKHLELHGPRVTISSIHDILYDFNVVLSGFTKVPQRTSISGDNHSKIHAVSLRSKRTKGPLHSTFPRTHTHTHTSSVNNLCTSRTSQFSICMLCLNFVPHPYCCWTTSATR